MLGKVFEGPLESRHKHSGALMFRRQDDIKDTYVRAICTHMWNFKKASKNPKIEFGVYRFNSRLHLCPCQRDLSLPLLPKQELNWGSLC